MKEKPKEQEVKCEPAKKGEGEDNGEKKEGKEEEGKKQGGEGE